MSARLHHRRSFHLPLIEPMDPAARHLQASRLLRAALGELFRRWRSSSAPSSPGKSRQLRRLWRLRRRGLVPLRRAGPPRRSPPEPEGRRRSPDRETLPSPWKRLRPALRGDGSVRDCSTRWTLDSLRMITRNTLMQQNFTIPKDTLFSVTKGRQIVQCSPTMRPAIFTEGSSPRQERGAASGDRQVPLWIARHTHDDTAAETARRSPGGVVRSANAEHFFPVAAHHF